MKRSDLKDREVLSDQQFSPILYTSELAIEVPNSGSFCGAGVQQTQTLS